VLLLRDVSRQTGMTIVCPTRHLQESAAAAVRQDDDRGHRRALPPGAHARDRRHADPSRLDQDRDNRERPHPDGHPYPPGGRADREEGRRAISLHSPCTDATKAVVQTLTREGFRLPQRFIWGHAQKSQVEDHIELASSGRSSNTTQSAPPPTRSSAGRETTNRCSTASRPWWRQASATESWFRPTHPST
jgi:hypothetical protein